MVDRFTFRAWDKKLKQMRYAEDGTDYDCKDLDEIYSDPFGRFSQALQCFDFENIVLMQCTGLKDKNDKLIYESDLVQYAKRDSSQGTFKTWVESNAKVGKIFFEKGGFHVDFGIEKLEPFLGAINEKLEIIGNIYENPELLK